MSYYIKGKGHFESSGAYIGSARKLALQRAKVCGYEGDSATFTRLIVESRVNRQAMNEAWALGVSMRKPLEVA